MAVARRQIGGAGDVEQAVAVRGVGVVRDQLGLLRDAIQERLGAEDHRALPGPRDVRDRERKLARAGGQPGHPLVQRAEATDCVKEGVQRVGIVIEPPAHVGASYPAFVAWFRTLSGFDLGQFGPRHRRRHAHL